LANIDLAALRADLTALETQVQEILVGFEDLMLTHLTVEERNELLTLTDIYRGWGLVIGHLTADVQALAALGYPTLPTLIIPAAFGEKLQHELQAEVLALSLLIERTPAVEGTLDFEPPIAQHA